VLARQKATDLAKSAADILLFFRETFAELCRKRGPLRVG
jgi:hypothetical protein